MITKQFVGEPRPNPLLSVSSKVGGYDKRLFSFRYSFYPEVEEYLVELVVEFVPISIEYIRLSDFYLIVVA